MTETKTRDVPVGDRDAILDWIDAGSRERAQAVLDAQALLDPTERDNNLVVDLTAWLQGGTVEAQALAPVEAKLPSTMAREEEMYLAELVDWERRNPKKAGDQPDDPGEVA